MSIKSEFLLSFARTKISVVRAQRPSDTLEAVVADHPFLRGIPSVGDGWTHMVRAMCEHLAQHRLPEGFEVTDVKEKYGELRASTAPYFDDIDEIIETYVTLSREICDVCGGPGKLTGSRWVATRCEEHA